MKYRIYSFMLLVLIVNCNNPNDTRPDGDVNVSSEISKDEGANIPTLLFGVDMKNMAIRTIINEIKSKGMQFEVCQSFSNGSSIGNINCINSKYFIGDELDKSKIRNVCYSIIPVDCVTRSIRIDFTREYYDVLKRILVSKYGRYKVGYVKEKVPSTTFFKENKDRMTLHWKSNSSQTNNVILLNNYREKISNDGQWEISSDYISLFFSVKDMQSCHVH